LTNTLQHTFSYSAFENYFRGNREEIKQRLSVYLPLVSLVPPLRMPPVLDIGCGRGEWLELLEENYINSIGIDSHQEFIEYCRERDLAAEEADLFDFLSVEREQRFSIITGFHLIEHIAPEKQLWFLDSIFRLLTPGGMVILETPNPENVTVGSCNFYIDPTHRRPVPPQLMHFLAIQAGFASPLIARLNRHTVGAPLKLMAEDEACSALYNQLVHIISSRVLQAPDYALIAFKPPSPERAMLQAAAALNRLNDSFVLPPDTSDALKENPMNTITSGVRIDSLNAYPEALRKTYHKLIKSRIEAGNETS